MDEYGVFYNDYETVIEALEAIEKQTTYEAKANKLFAIIDKWAGHCEFAITDELDDMAKEYAQKAYWLIRNCNDLRICMRNADVYDLVGKYGNFITLIIELLGGKDYQKQSEEWKDKFFDSCMDYLFPNCKAPQEPQLDTTPQPNLESLKAESKQSQPDTTPQPNLEPLKAESKQSQPDTTPQPNLEPLILGNREPLTRAVFDLLTKEKPEWMVVKDGKYKWVYIDKKGNNFALLAYICNCIQYGIEGAMIEYHDFNTACMFETYFFGKDKGKMLKAMQQTQRNKSIDGRKYRDAREIIVKAQKALTSTTPPRL